MRVRQHFHDALDVKRDTRRRMLAVPSVLVLTEAGRLEKFQKKYKGVNYGQKTDV